MENDTLETTAAYLTRFLEGPPADRLAVRSRQGSLSYGQMREHVWTLAGRLRQEGLAAEDRVVICADRSPLWIIGCLGVLHAGATYVPIDPQLPPPLRLQLLQALGPRLLLVEPRLVDSFAGSAAPVLSLAAAGGGYPEAGRAPMAVHPLQAAYGIYTSGSTGVPKSVVIPHQAVASYAEVLRRLLSLGPGDCYLHTASLAFSASIRQLLAPLASEATIALASRDDVRDPTSLCSWMVSTGVTVLDTVPSYLSTWLTAVAGLTAESRARLSASLRLVLTTGEPLPARTAQRLRQVFPEVRQLNLYGQTETAGTVAAHDLAPAEQDPVPVGVALSPTELRPLGPDLELASVGHVAELYVSGPSLARGYDGRADLTAARFLPDPFSREPGARMYRTGDRVRRRPDGRLEFVGRTDHQVKVHGVRIELGEVEAALAAHPGVRQTVALLRSAGGDGRLVAYFVPEITAAPVSSPELRAHLASRLSESAIPSAIVAIAELPLTATGKIDRPALAARELPVAAVQGEALAGGVLESLVAQCWRETLRLSQVSGDDDFFSLGGDSLQAVEMALSLQKRLPIPLPLLALFFQDPTLSGLVQGIELEAGEEGLAAIERHAGATAGTDPAPERVSIP